jgi:hypothetical protein
VRSIRCSEGESERRIIPPGACGTEGARNWRGQRRGMREGLSDDRRRARLFMAEGKGEKACRAACGSSRRRLSARSTSP